MTGRLAHGKRMTNHPIVVGITGASGAIYAVRLLEALLAAGRNVHVLISPSARDVLQQELAIAIDLEHFDVNALRLRNSGATGGLRYFHYLDFHAPAASGSFLTAGMVICPTSGASLSGVATGAANNLILRAAETHLKEGRKLILVPRETPLSLVHIDNMRRAAEAGAVILPASPGFYHGAKTIDDLVDFVVARICDQLDVDHHRSKRWGKNINHGDTLSTEKNDH
jgi:4-hydroxy-3-polyprenylbenzoate decarboxylase